MKKAARDRNLAIRKGNPHGLPPKASKKFRTPSRIRNKFLRSSASNAELRHSHKKLFMSSQDKVQLRNSKLKKLGGVTSPDEFIHQEGFNVDKESSNRL
jgi:hypothetical protein